MLPPLKLAAVTSVAVETRDRADVVDVAGVFEFEFGGKIFFVVVVSTELEPRSGNSEFFPTDSCRLFFELAGFLPSIGREPVVALSLMFATLHVDQFKVRVLDSPLLNLPISMVMVERLGLSKIL